MRAGPTKSGGREIVIDSPWLKARVVDGVAVEWEPRTPAEPKRPEPFDCIHLGPVSRTVSCRSCKGRVRVKLYKCDIHGECEPYSQRAEGVRRCQGCSDHARASFTPVLVMGTGRCGTRSIAHLLNAQKGVLAEHEPRPLLPWEDGPIKPRIDRLRDRDPSASIVAEVALWLLPRARRFLEEYPEGKILVMRRDREDMIDSFIHKMARDQPGIDHWRKPHGETDPWSCCFPTFEAEDMEEALGLYWDHYERETDRLVIDYPDRVRVLHTSELNRWDRMSGILRWLGIEEARQEMRVPHVNIVWRSSGRVPTILIPTFERPMCLEKTLKAIESMHPGSHVIVGDDSARPYSREVVGSVPYLKVDVVELPFDSGLSIKRNVLIDKVDTELFVMQDDDMIFRPGGIPRLVELLQLYGLDYIGGLKLDDRMRPSHWEANFELIDKTLYCRPVPQPYVDECVSAHMVSNAGVWRSERAGGIWPDPIKIGSEHWLGYFRAWQRGLRGAVARDVWFEDEGTSPSNEYQFMRRKRVKYFQQMALRLADLDQVVLLRGHGWKREPWFETAEEPVLPAGCS